MQITDQVIKKEKGRTQKGILLGGLYNGNICQIQRESKKNLASIKIAISDSLAEKLINDSVFPSINPTVAGIELMWWEVDTDGKNKK
jgi:hypothetical protein